METLLSAYCIGENRHLPGQKMAMRPPGSVAGSRRASEAYEGF